MEAVAISLGLVPYLSGRMILAIGVLIAWYTLQGVWHQGELSLRSVAFGIGAGVASVALQVVVEWLRERLADLVDSYRELMRRVDLLIVPLAAMALAAYLLGLLGAGASMLVNDPAPALELRRAGVAGEALLVLGVGGVAYAFARLRAWIGGLFDHVPLSGESGVRRVLFLAESAWTVAGVLVALLLPLLGLVFMTWTLGALLAVGLVLRRVERGARAPCEGCAAELHLAASACPRCAAPRAPRRLGLFGRVLAGPVQDPGKHRHALLAARRCPACAERLEHGDDAVACSGCGARPFADPEEARLFQRYVDARTAALGPAVALCGLVPVLGLGAALVLYRLSPAGALGGYVSWQERLGTRLLRGLALFGLAFLQPVPVVGAFAALAIVSVTHLWTRRAFLASVEPAPAPAAPAALVA